MNSTKIDSHGALATEFHSNNLEQKLLACIHCGLCLEACPTYVITGDENDGPRGRLYLMRSVAEGRLANTSQAFSKHIDRCLGCRACEQVCPAGVEYGQLLEASREEIREAQPRPGLDQALLSFALRHIWLSKSRLKFFFGASRVFRNLRLPALLLKLGISKLSPQLGFSLALIDSSRSQFSAPVTRSVPRPAQPDQAEKVLLFAGCVGEGLFPEVNRATERVLRANGFDVRVPEDQVCCGALHAHAGDLEGARMLAKKNIAAFNSDAPIITNAGGCGAMLATYSHLLADDERVAAAAERFSARVKDISQQLETREMRVGAKLENSKVTYDTSCHLLYGQHAGDSSRRMVQGSCENFVGLEGTERCCGAAGVYNLLQFKLSQQVLQEKLRNVAATEASVLATGNPGCQMHLGAGARMAGLNIKVCHPIQLLDQSYADAGFYSE